jgi:tRNA(Ile)-lysidine synthase
MAGGGEKVLVAVSGGADSVCLLHLFLEARRSLGLRLAVAHFDHGLRGASSRADASFVRKLAARHRLAFYQERSSGREDGGEGLQETARRERLDFLLRTARRRRCHRVALAHNADDQAETMIMRFLAGGGPAGLGGIPPLSHGEIIIHPLLEITRGDIEAYLEDRGISWRRDLSNEKPVYLRNRLRLELLPQLASRYNPRIVERLGELAALLRRDSELLDALAGPVLQESSSRRDEYFFPTALLKRSHPALLTRAFLTALRSLAPRERGFGRRHLEALLTHSGTARLLTWDLPGGIVAYRDGTGLALRKGRLPFPATTGSHLPAPGSALLPRSLGKVTASVRRKGVSFDPSRLAGLPWKVALDWEKVVPPILLRCRQPGDRIRPLGLGGERKIKDILIDRKVPRLSRDRLPLVCDSRGIIWVPGIVPSHRCRVTQVTKKLLFLRAHFEFPMLPQPARARRSRSR